jgi:hypothetical protein
MSRLPCRLIALITLIFPALIRADDEWSQMKLGMTPEETVALLGQPLLSTKGRGFETWIYDHGAEILLYDTVIGWTTPGLAKVGSRSTDVWRANGARPYFPTFMAAVPRRREPAPEPRAVPQGAPQGGGSTEDIWLPAYVGRAR